MELKETGVRVQPHNASLSMSEMLEKYVDVEKFLGYCTACPRCGQTWSCPPYDFDPADIWPRYEALSLHALQIFPESEEAKAAALSDVEGFLRPFREALDRLLEALERGTPGSLRLDAGRCLVCERCARRDEKACRFPAKLRYSLESLGGDVAALAAEKLGVPLRWGTKDAPAEYYVLVGALLTGEK